MKKMKPAIFAILLGVSAPLSPRTLRTTELRALQEQHFLLQMTA
jgi:hypothetical protein